jgi:hypothetical protein
MRLECKLNRRAAWMARSAEEVPFSDYRGLPAVREAPFLLPFSSGFQMIISPDRLGTNTIKGALLSTA